MNAELDSKKAGRIGGNYGCNKQLPADALAPEPGHHAHTQLTHMALVPTAGTNNIAPAHHLSVIGDGHKLRIITRDIVPHEIGHTVDGRRSIAPKKTRLARDGIQRRMEARYVVLRYPPNQHFCLPLFDRSSICSRQAHDVLSVIYRIVPDVSRTVHPGFPDPAFASTPAVHKNRQHAMIHQYEARSGDGARIERPRRVP